MNTIFRVFCLLCFFLLSAGFANATVAADTGKISLPPAAKPLITLSPAAAELTQQLQALVTGGQETELEPQETFGTRALGVVLAFIDLARDEAMAFIDSFSAIPQAVTWFIAQLDDQRILDHWNLIGRMLVTVVGASLLIGYAAYFAMTPLRRKMMRRQPSSAGARIEILFLWFCMALVPICVFLGAALLFLDQYAPPKFERYVVLNVVYAFALQHLVSLIARFFLAPRSPQLRLLPIQSSQALYILRWIRAISFVMILGYFCIDLAKIIRMPPASMTAFGNLLGLIVAVMAITIIVQKRAFVSSTLRGNLSAAHPNLSLLQSLRLWLARTWHILAIAYLVIGYIVTTFGAENNLAYMQRGTILTMLVLIAMWLASYMNAKFGHRSRRDKNELNAGIFKPVLYILIRIMTWVLGAAGIAAAWGIDVMALVATPWGQRITGSAFSITSTLVIVVSVYELLHNAIERKLNPRDADGNVLQANSRARTLLPMLRHAAIIVLSVIVGLVTLSELGINIAPLLAGAGVIGVAVGFGSQTLVKDFLTGLFIILEDTIALGDVVEIGEHSGVVDAMALRTIRLRDIQGAVHILPYSEITKLINKTKNYSFAVIDITVDYNSDLRQTMEVIKDIGREIRNEPILNDSIIEDLEMLGVESYGDAGINIRCRIKTKPGKQWEIKRAFLLFAKYRLDKEKIELPYPITALLGKLATPAITK